MARKTQSRHSKSAVKVRDMEAKKSPKAGRKGGGRHHTEISVVKTTDKSSQILFQP